MTDQELETLYQICFPHDANPWRAKSFHALRHDRGGVMIIKPNAVLLGRVVMDEAEILSIFVNPAQRHQGFARQLIEEFMNICAHKGARFIHLEVERDNKGARALYNLLGFEATGLRKNYYQKRDGRRVDARLLSLAL